MLIQRVRNVIDEISVINKNDVIGVCDFCKRSHEKNKCKRCQYIVKKFVANKAIQNENREVQFKLWLSRLEKILFSIFESNVICKHNISLDSKYKAHLYRLLNYLNSPVPMRQPEIGAFPELFDRKETGVDFDENEKLLQDLVTQLKYKESDEDSYTDINFSPSGSESECICKHFVSNKSDRKPAPLDEIVSQDKVSLSKMHIAKDNDNISTLMTSSEHQKNYKSKSETFTESPSTGQKLKEGRTMDISKTTDVSKTMEGSKTRKLKGNKENDLPKQVSKNGVKKGTEKKGAEKSSIEKMSTENISTEKKGTEKIKKEKQTSEYRLMLQMLKEREKEKKLAEKLGKSKTKHQLPAKRNYGDHSGSHIILHNTSNRDIKRFDYIYELCRYKTKCIKCKMLIQRVRNVIDEISVINKNDVIGVCDFCKRSHEKNKCKRCQYIVKKFVANKAIQNENREVQFKLWLSRLEKILFSIFESNVICKHNISLDSKYKAHLYRLLNYLNSPVPMRQPEIGAFPELFDRKETGVDFDENEKLLQDLVTQLKYKESDEDSYTDINFSPSGSESECICKHFVSNKSDRKPAPLDEIVSQDKVSLSKMHIAKDNDNISTLMTSSEHQKNYKSKSETFTESPSTGQKLKEGRTMDISKTTDVSKTMEGSKTRKLKGNKENDLPKQVSKNGVKKGTEKKGAEKSSIEKMSTENISTEKKGTEKIKKEKQTSEYRLMLQMLKEREKEKKLAEKLGKSKTKHQLPVIKDLPQIKRRVHRVKAIESTQKSDSILECRDEHLHVIDKMIKGTEIVRLPSNYRAIDEEFERLPLLFKIETKISEPTNEEPFISLPIPQKETKKKTCDKEITVQTTGILRYELSNREFIEKGWTKLPSTKIMRRMNIYKMLPASDKYDWFKTYNSHKTLFYNTGERFAEINETGGGKWFYKNGNVALDGHTAADSNVVKRYVIYSSGEEIIGRKKEPITILACFDYSGNGVVYDGYGNVRLKYNQSEGVLVDKNISTPGRWKWHTLNDPPVLQQVYLNTYDECSNVLPVSKIHANEEMIAIELDNFLKEKAHKLMQKFKPFQVKIKALKINDSFSLRILDQANIFLLFRCDGIYFKISIGMLLKSREIIDTDVAEMAEVSTPYDVFPPRSPSLVNIHNTLSNVRKHYNSSKKNK